MNNEELRRAIVASQDERLLRCHSGAHTCIGPCPALFAGAVKFLVDQAAGRDREMVAWASTSAADRAKVRASLEERDTLIKERDFYCKKSESSEALFRRLWSRLGDEDALRALGMDPERIKAADEELRSGQTIALEDLDQELIDAARRCTERAKVDDINVPEIISRSENALDVLMRLARLSVKARKAMTLLSIDDVEQWIWEYDSIEPTAL